MQKKKKKQYQLCFLRMINVKEVSKNRSSFYTRKTYRYSITNAFAAVTHVFSVILHRAFIARQNQYLHQLYGNDLLCFNSGLRPLFHASSSD